MVSAVGKRLVEDRKPGEPPRFDEPRAGQTHQCQPGVEARNRRSDRLRDFGVARRRIVECAVRLDVFKLQPEQGGLLRQRPDLLRHPGDDFVGGRRQLPAAELLAVGVARVRPHRDAELCGEPQRRRHARRIASVAAAGDRHPPEVGQQGAVVAAFADICVEFDHAISSRFQPAPASTRAASASTVVKHTASPGRNCASRGPSALTMAAITG